MKLIVEVILMQYSRFIFDAMHAVTGAYAKPIFVDLVWFDMHILWKYQLYVVTIGCILFSNFSLVLQDCISNEVPLEDFGHGRPDPNLTYGEEKKRKILY